jgi:hypothetical protein
MKTNAKNFTHMKGHVSDNCQIIGSNDRIYTLKNTLKGWMIFDDKNTPISGNLKSFFDVEFFVINGLGA